MTEITRSIEISAPIEEVWTHIQPENWTKIFSSVREVNGYTEGKPGVGTQAQVIAGKDDETAIKYNVEITEFIENKRIIYRRYGGPLSGKGMIKVQSLQNGTLLTRTGYYDDDLSGATIEALSEGMEHDNKRIKTGIESQS